MVTMTLLHHQSKPKAMTMTVDDDDDDDNGGAAEYHSKYMSIILQ